mmetsp:Transcript_27698/g.80285  ORF Transcript_27698/g.80285 Transcript_27698/m.80285 type:complete len:246 (+) Transcript_27698:820-1557(+)
MQLLDDRFALVARMGIVGLRDEGHVWLHVQPGMQHLSHGVRILWRNFFGSSLRLQARLRQGAQLNIRRSRSRRRRRPIVRRRLRRVVRRPRRNAEKVPRRHHFGPNMCLVDRRRRCLDLHLVKMHWAAGAVVAVGDGTAHAFFFTLILVDAARHALGQHPAPGGRAAEPAPVVRVVRGLHRLVDLREEPLPARAVGAADRGKPRDRLASVVVGLHRRSVQAASVLAMWAAGAEGAAAVRQAWRPP